MCNHNQASIIDPKPGRNCIWHIIWYKISSVAQQSLVHKGQYNGSVETSVHYKLTPRIHIISVVTVNIQFWHHWKLLIIFHISVQEHLTLNSTIHNFNCQHFGHLTNEIASIIFYHFHVDASLGIPCSMTQLYMHPSNCY